MSSNTKVEEAKRSAAYACVDAHVASGQVIGVGTGSTIVYAVERIAERYRNKDIVDIKCIPTSFQARHLILDNNLPLSDLERDWVLDVCLDGADEVDPQLNCIKGGGACMTWEKIVMSCARRFFVVADYRKKSTGLGSNWPTIPLEVVPGAYRAIARRVEETESGTCTLRMAQRKAGPVVTDNGNFILDWAFPKLESGADGDTERTRTTDDWRALNQRLQMIPGMLETGLFVGMAERAYFGMADGSVSTLSAPENSPARGLYAICDGAHPYTPTKASILYKRQCSTATGGRDCGCENGATNGNVH